jgi:hypothetical protein
MNKPPLRRVLTPPPGTREERRQWWETVPEASRRQNDINQAWNCMFEPDHNRSLQERAIRRMERVDAMSPDMRAVVYDHGLEVVQVLIDHKLRNPNQCRRLIEFITGAERPHSKRCIEAVMSLGFTLAKAMFLIDTILGADYENGQARFRPNKAPNTRPNPLCYDDDDEAYFVLGPAVTRAA